MRLRALTPMYHTAFDSLKMNTHFLLHQTALQATETLPLCLCQDYELLQTRKTRNSVILQVAYMRFLNQKTFPSTFADFQHCQKHRCDEICRVWFGWFRSCTVWFTPLALRSSMSLIFPGCLRPNLLLTTASPGKSSRCKGPVAQPHSTSSNALL